MRTDTRTGRVLLVAPASGRWHGVGRRRLFSGRTFRFSLLSLLAVAAETPPDCEVCIIDEQVEDVPFDAHWDLVGITAMTATAPRAYGIGDAFRARGVPVVLGGMHPTFLPHEGLQHADAVVCGEAEGIWRQVVADARAGRLAGIYRAAAPPALEALATPPRHLLDGRRYATVQAVQATRGCPNRCAFCAVSAFHGGRQRRRPIPDIVAEVAALPGRFFLLVDDSLAADLTWAGELLDALAPAGKHWMSQLTLSVTDDPDLVRRAARAGCVGVFVGLESFSPASLVRVDKGFNRVEEYRERVDLLHRHGIGVEAGIVLGLDGDGPEVFGTTLEGLDRLAVDMAQVSVLTPLPGTPLFGSMADRIIDRDWSHYDYHHVVFRPEAMTPDELQVGHDWLTREFYRPWRIARRLARLTVRPHAMRTLPYATAINAAYWGRVASWGIGRGSRVKWRAPEATPWPRPSAAVRQYGAETATAHR